MQLELQHAEPQTDPHDAIAAQLRKLAAPRLVHDPSEIDVTPTLSSEHASEPSSPDTLLNDNSDSFRGPSARAWSGQGIAMLAACAGIAATVVWHSYGDEAKQRLSDLMPQVLAGVSALTQSASNAKPADAVSQTAAPRPADVTPAQEPSTSQTQHAATEAAPTINTPSTPAPLPPDVAQSIETMTQEIASLKQTVEELRAGQQQLGRDVAKVTEQETRRKLATQTAKPSSRPPRVLGAPPHPLGTLAPSSLPPAYSQGQAYPQRNVYVPPAAQLPPPPGDSNAPRPPAPLR